MSVRFDSVFITGQHVEILQHDAAALASHRLDVLVKGGLIRIVIEVAQRIDAVLLADQRNLPARFRLQNPAAAGSPLHVVKHILGKVLNRIILRNIRKEIADRMLRRVRLRSGYGKVKRPDIAVDNVHDRSVPNADGKHGIQNADG